ncbi:single-stranded-DNA-specific exonuclease RecJ [Corticibacter populi]|uniref:Single-stranded-DNA-specific exonuclease RecJ n=1 Tax=Corticibacter populi TaxID=1550736 RepID=A0A3M6QMI2_9BURK|nr:single-stranded-DNA-specific exonuclease RecJ [Corticibacter populi]RMX03612.1 single-stranded-DNA-specific exonuclease RecJ [Corticibacter populi]RZS30070.1 exonuclease RecJ [Corticibacter populi]
MQFRQREIPDAIALQLQQAGVHPFLARLLAARGIASASELDHQLRSLLPPQGLKGIDAAAALLAEAIAADWRICIVADYDCDGATACTVALRGLRMLGARHVDYLVPNRIQDGYGLTAPLAERVHQRGAELLLTVDNGIASIEGVARARELGLRVLVTDHHLPAAQLPEADAIVNPNQPGCAFASKHLAGVGVLFYTLLALRSRLRAQGVFTTASQPRLDTLLPLVALGTVADVVPLDANNRLLAGQGLARIRAGQMPAGMAALFEVAGRNPAHAQASDMGFALAPRLNAAGRLTDMTIGIECLLTDDAQRAAELAAMLDDINRARRELETDMKQVAIGGLIQRLARNQRMPAVITACDASFHEGVVGIVAARIKEQFHRPTFIFAPSASPDSPGLLKGSGRSIPGFHLRDALDLLAKRHPGVLDKFGGHAMAAGCSLAEAQLPIFQQAIETIATEWLDAAALQGETWVDGPLPPEHRSIATAELLRLQIWGQGFAAPLFLEELDVLEQRVVAGKHLAMKLLHHGQVIDAIWFGHTERLPARARLAYRMETDEWMGRKRLRFLVEAQA